MEQLAIKGGQPVRKNYLPYGHQWIDDDDIQMVNEVFKSDWITQGPSIEKFEKQIAKYCGVKYAVAVSSGTAALHLACLSANVKTGDEAITTPITFVATANAIVYSGGKPVFADIRSDTITINTKEIIKKITKKTKAILPVDFAGHPADLGEINDIAHDRGLITIEDGAHAFGATYRGKKIGEISDMTVFSFHPVKHITTGEGGMILTNNEEFFEKLCLLRTHGITKDKDKLSKNDGDWYYEMQDLGFNYRITDFQCALGLSQLKKVGMFINRRREIVRQYNEAFKDIEEIITPFEAPYVESTYHLYIIKLRLDMLKENRRTIFNALRAENIGVHVHYIPVHLQPYYTKNFGYKPGMYPIAESYYASALTLPLFPAMNGDDVEDVINAVKKIIITFRDKP